MTDQVVSREESTGGQVQRLKRDAIGTLAVIFMAVATAAPITAMVGNVPIAVGFGNGSHAPAGYFVATVVLGLFAIGYATMAKHITATGAFYGYITHGLGRVVGMASGVIITMAYVVFEGSLIGIFSFFFQDFAATQFAIDVPWLVPAILMLTLNCILTYFDVNLAAKVLGVFLITEIFMLSLGALAVLFRGGGPDGFAVAETLNPAGAFSPAAGIAGASAGIGLFFAFWSWVGFESTAMYGEESKDPKRIIPRATMISVLGVGIFYVFISWMAIAGTGPQKSVELAQDSATAGNIFFDPVQATYGDWAITMFKFLLVTGSFACGMAFHNTAARYMYSLAREGVLPHALSRTHHSFKSPHVASFTQSLLAVIWIALFAYFLGTDDPNAQAYVAIYTMLAILGTMLLLILQAVVSIAIIAYFRANPSDDAGIFSTVIAPVIAFVAQVYLVYLLVQNLATFGGSGSFGSNIPWIALAIVVIGFIWGVVLRIVSPNVHARIGRMVFND